MIAEAGIENVKVVATGVEGIGFAIPSDEAVPIIKELIENKKVARPSIGISGINVTEAISKAYNACMKFNHFLTNKEVWNDFEREPIKPELPEPKVEASINFSLAHNAMKEGIFFNSERHGR